MIHEEINILALIKGEERYVFLFNEKNRIELLRTLGRYAADPQLSFSWYDAAVLSKRIRDIAYEETVANAAKQQSQTHPSTNRRFSFHPEEDII